ncbi:protein translocase subunit SecF [Jatrophihabitans telluris]|uniref:Protein-export membrane protein SecF n=1 Tax=Jatrophihabitans telluris TaxID=2038343 RepID=A0ABY4QTB1_9ACTN|nr:protein translocase subunit SecF [Jatrophihabitans telluris]UQX86800.1 protein translocase subunit SecF [Jatrophihabitans telluris]
MGLASKLYRGETRFDFIGTRRRWYAASLLLVLVCLLSFLLRGFNVGIDFKGGTQFQVPGGSGVTATTVDNAMSKGPVHADGAAQQVGNGGNRSVIIKTKEISQTEQTAVKNALAGQLKIPASSITVDSVSSTWGSEITKKAVQGLIVFLIAVFIYITIRYEWKMGIAALVALLHDLIISAGIYSIVGFELTPSTIVGLLTILGFSLYDTVVVFDKVNENVRDLGATARMTYGEAANLAVNQTLMRSINTSLISLLPVAGLLFVGAGLLGVGTIKDLALILFIGLAVGAYSSLFLATPIVVELKEREAESKALAKRVAAKRAAAAKSGEPVLAGAAGVEVNRPATLGTPAPAPRPGARPSRKQPRKRP